MGDVLHTTMASTNCLTDSGPSLFTETSRISAKKLGCVSCVKHGGGGGGGGGGAGATGESGGGDGGLGGGDGARGGAASSGLISVSLKIGVLSRSTGSGCDAAVGSDRDLAAFFAALATGVGNFLALGFFGVSPSDSASSELLLALTTVWREKNCIINKIKPRKITILPFSLAFQTL